MLTMGRGRDPCSDGMELEDGALVILVVGLSRREDASFDASFLFLRANEWRYVVSEKKENGKIGFTRKLNSAKHS